MVDSPAKDNRQTRHIQRIGFVTCEPFEHKQTQPSRQPARFFGATIQDARNIPAKYSMAWVSELARKTIQARTTIRKVTAIAANSRSEGKIRPSPAMRDSCSGALPKTSGVKNKPLRNPPNEKSPVGTVPKTTHCESDQDGPKPPPTIIQAYVPGKRSVDIIAEQDDMEMCQRLQNSAISREKYDRRNCA